jgi:CRP-like cAMP-binding protein
MTIERVPRSIGEGIGSDRAFRQLNERIRAMASVAQVAGERRFEEGEVLVRQGDPGESFLILVAGRAEVTKDGTPIRTLGRADFLGEIALLDGGSRTATVTATTPVDALVIEREPFLRLMDESPALRFGVMDELTRRLRRDATRDPLA